jgi:protein gp37
MLIASTPSLRWMLLTKRVGNARAMLEAMFPDGVPPNVALGVTIANQEEADRDQPKAIAVKNGLGIRRLFISAEPLLSRLDLRRYLAFIDLVIVGGESGKNARSMPEEWATTIKLDCYLRHVPFHFKQQSQADHPRTYHLPETYPPALQIREHFA